jgi:outer membrane protein assembly factor BamA
MIKRYGFLIILCFLASFRLWALPEEKTKNGLRFSGVPALGFGSDSGFGGGIIGNLYLDEEGYEPYRLSLGLKAFLTTKLVNSHALQLDWLDAFSLPLRLTTRIGFFTTFSQNYCGKASDADCNQENAELAANRLHLSGEDRDEFLHRYYQYRYMNIYGDLFGRWGLWQKNGKLELLTSYRGRYYLNRDFSEKGYYEGSLFEKDLAKENPDGYLSTIELGLMFDKRDNEPAPSSGYWLETSVRGGHSLWGSAWDYLGFSLAGRVYFPLDEGKSLVLASQSIADAILGDLPYDALSRIGGSQSISDFSAIGGQYIGRGIREQMFVGRFKVIEQLELRYSFWSFLLWRQHFTLTAALFTDLAMTAWDYQRFTRDMKKLHSSFGTGLRITWNKTFIVRADLGMSPEENFIPRFYLLVGNVF